MSGVGVARGGNGAVRRLLAVFVIGGLVILGAILSAGSPHG